MYGFLILLSFFFKKKKKKKKKKKSLNKIRVLKKSNNYKYS